MYNLLLEQANIVWNSVSSFKVTFYHSHFLKKLICMFTPSSNSWIVSLWQEKTFCPQYPKLLTAKRIGFHQSLCNYDHISSKSFTVELYIVVAHHQSCVNANIYTEMWPHYTSKLMQKSNLVWSSILQHNSKNVNLLQGGHPICKWATWLH